jgi:hypothetical protein
MGFCTLEMPSCGARETPLFLQTFIKSDDAFEIGEKAKSIQGQLGLEPGPSAGDRKVKRFPKGPEKVPRDDHPFPEVIASPLVKEGIKRITGTEHFPEVNLLKDPFDQVLSTQVAGAIDPAFPGALQGLANPLETSARASHPFQE